MLLLITSFQEIPNINRQAHRVLDIPNSGHV